VLVGLGALAACGFEGVGSLAPEGLAPSGDASSDASSEAVLPPSSDGGPVADASSDALVDAADSGLRFPYVYGHTVTTLYRLDPVTKAFSVVGPLTGCANMADIAVDRDGKIIGVGSALYAIDPTTGACTPLALGAQPFTLSFVPAGTVAPTEEALVAYVGSDYYRVNRTTGVLTLITSFAITPHLPSGDLVSVEGGGTYVSVTSPGCADCLLEVSPTDGTIVKNLGSIGQAQIFGLGQWAGKVYGFAGNGETYELTIGASSVTSTLVTNANKPTSWIGGGSSTRAPK
jgi:hypothetical protein